MGLEDRVSRLEESVLCGKRIRQLMVICLIGFLSMALTRDFRDEDIVCRSLSIVSEGRVVARLLATDEGGAVILMAAGESGTGSIRMALAADQDGSSIDLYSATVEKAVIRVAGNSRASALMVGEEDREGKRPVVLSASAGHQGHEGGSLDLSYPDGGGTATITAEQNAGGLVIRNRSGSVVAGVSADDYGNGYVVVSSRTGLKSNGLTP